jgi:hypothetical protein
VAPIIEHRESGDKLFHLRAVRFSKSAVSPNHRMQFVGQNTPMLLTIRALFVSYAERFNAIQFLAVYLAFSNLIFWVVIK